MSVDSRHAVADVAAEANCPDCDGPMRERNGPHGAFLGCLRFPECRGTREIDSGQGGGGAAADPGCPACAAPLDAVRVRGITFAVCRVWAECRACRRRMRGEVDGKETRFTCGCDRLPVPVGELLGLAEIEHLFVVERAEGGMGFRRVTHRAACARCRAQPSFELVGTEGRWVCACGAKYPVRVGVLLPPRAILGGEQGRRARPAAEGRAPGAGGGASSSSSWPFPAPRSAAAVGLVASPPPPTLPRRGGAGEGEGRGVNARVSGAPACPKCEAPMRERNKGDKIYYLCSRYPDCRTSIDAVEPPARRPAAARSTAKPKSGAGACPKCPGRMVRRKGPYGDFYSCDRYPACTTTRPVATRPRRQAAAAPGGGGTRRKGSSTKS